MAPGIKGTFQYLCKWGHPRADNVGHRGQCLTCKNGDAQPRVDFKPTCIRGHKREGNVDAGGHCNECREIWKRTEMRSPARRNAGWKNKGILREDGSPFTLNDYNRAFQIQGGLCKGCSVHQSEMEKALHADHDHATGAFRGLLCSRCNFILGNAKDRASVLRALADYLEAA